MKENYNFLLLVEKEVCNSLKDGVELFEVYKSTQLFAETKNSNLAINLEKKFGLALSQNFKEESMVISPNTKAIAKKYMIFAIDIKFSGLKEEGHAYTLCTIDTVIVRKDKAARPLTQVNKTLQKFVIDETNTNRLENVTECKRFKLLSIGAVCLSTS